MNATRNLIYVDSGSSKFCNITCDGKTVAEHSGVMGTQGETRLKKFWFSSRAERYFLELVQERISEGYFDADSGVELDEDSGIEIDEDPAPSAGSRTLPASPYSTILTTEDAGVNIRRFMGRSVADYKPGMGLRPDTRVVHRVRKTWEREDLKFSELLESLLNEPDVSQLTALVIGAWNDEYDDDSSEAVDTLARCSDRLPLLRGLYLGDIVSEENEISWINQSDVTPLLTAYPELEVLRVRGGNGLKLKRVEHANLKALAIETGGLSTDVLRGVFASQFPKLEHLEIWLGTEEYGATSTVQDLQPLFSGELFPNLKYLGLRNCEYADDIAGVIVNSPIVHRIESLDLSLGTLTETGGNALLQLPAGGSLKNLLLHHHYIPAPVVKKLMALPLAVDASNPRHHTVDDNEEWRFVAVGE